MWQQTPGTPATVNVEDGIQDFTPGMLAGASGELFFRKVWRDYAPFGIVEVSRVSLSGFGHSTSLPDFCRCVEFSDALVDNLVGANTDYRTLGEGLYDILSHAIDRVQAVKPGALIEFRNSYTNLASRRYANLYRASDVPINFALNRWQVTMLRLLAPDRVVYLDPALWHPDDTEENVAAHLINAISTVPMVSIELDRYPQSHLDLIRYWIGFYRAHRDTIIHGQFAPEIRLGHVPLIRFTGETERIIGVYDDIAFAPGGGPMPLWILNASARPFVELFPDSLTGVYNICTRDKFGRVVSENAVAFPVSRLPVEVGGSLKVQAR